MAEEFDAIVIGAGEAGAVVGSAVVGAGKRAAMIYRAPYGSTCVNTGCVPSKFLIHRARVAHVARTAARFRVHTTEPTVDVVAIIADKNAMIEEHREEGLSAARQAENLTLLEGPARFASDREVVVGDRRLRSERIFIATGMSPEIPSIDGLGDVPALTNESLMELPELPEHLVVVGGGYVACELGQTYRRYGSRVTIVQSRDHLCPEEEPDVSTLLERAFRAEGIELVLGHRALRVERRPGGILLVARSREDTERVIEGTHLLCAAGRRPNTDDLNLEAAGVDTADDGSIPVNAYLETNVPGIWAIGDVNGQQPFTRVCQEEAKVAFSNAFNGTRLEMQRGFLGHAIFSDPEIGSVGLTEQQARDAGHDVVAGLVTFARVEKAEIIGETRGLIKYVIDRRSHEVLGCHVIGPDAANLIYDAIIVMRHGGTIGEIAKAVGIFPTLQEGMEGTARGLLRKVAPEELEGPLVTSPLHHIYSV